MSIYLQTIEDLEKRVKEAGIDIAVRQSFLTDPTNAVRNLKVKCLVLGTFADFLHFSTKVFAWSTTTVAVKI